MAEKSDKGGPMNSVSSVYDVSLIQFPKILDPRGNLTFIEQERSVQNLPRLLDL